MLYTEDLRKHHMLEDDRETSNKPTEDQLLGTSTAHSEREHVEDESPVASVPLPHSHGGQLLDTQYQPALNFLVVRVLYQQSLVFIETNCSVLLLVNGVVSNVSVRAMVAQSLFPFEWGLPKNTRA